MKRVFFKRPTLATINKQFYREMVEKIKAYQEENCQKVNGKYNCEKCYFYIKPYCLMNILKEEFKEV